jgi:hypothetical protein
MVNKEFVVASGYCLLFVAVRRLNLAQPFKAGIMQQPNAFVASATAERFNPRWRDEMENTFSIPAFERPG